MTRNFSINFHIKDRDYGDQTCCLGTCISLNRKTDVRSVAGGWEGRLSACGLTLIKLKGKRTVDASGAGKMVLKVVKICGHIFQVSK